ncbi:hypothetical protein GCM10011391_07190 [Pullulanibacillus camelliae]|uniref:Transposase DDE domain-containing protein n=1 Tax=Pullulanibacillus camelliae TaxID=1707096 RepID=A0A8J2VLX6_9BACL|nr:hypothetical protein GCM10011391_07190 [Pullulanibacillus camelliae]
MAPLPQITHDFNRRMKLSNDGGALSSDTGEFIFRECDEKVDFSQPLIQHLKLKDERHYFVHANEQLIRQKLYQMIARYSEDDAADQSRGTKKYADSNDTDKDH